MIEKDYLINEISNKLETQDNQIKRLNEQIKEFKKSLNKILEEKDNINVVKRNTTLNPTRMREKIFNSIDRKSNNYLNNNNEYNKNINEKSIKLNMKNNIKKRNTDMVRNVQKFPKENGNPNDLKFKYDLVNTNTKGGLNDIFEVFKSIKDNEDYLVSPNKMNFNLDLINLKGNKFYGSLRGHQKKVTCVRYFLNDYTNNEYLISSDEIGIIFIWNISDSYKKLFTINTKYNDIIYSCLIIFTESNYENDNSNSEKNNGYIITSTYDISKENQNSATKIYSMSNGEFINYIKNTNANSVFYLLSWINKKNKRNYIIQFCYMKILITNLLDDDDVYAELSQEQKLSHYSGFIYEKKLEDKVYLYSSSKNGIINIWDLYNKVLINSIDIKGSILCHIIQWDEKYAIVADYNGKSFRIINMDTLEVEQNIGDSHTKEVKTIKKVRLPILGDSLLTAGNDNMIKLWSI